MTSTERPAYISSISRMIENTTDRKLKIIYEFTLSMTKGDYPNCATAEEEERA